MHGINFYQFLGASIIVTKADIKMVAQQTIANKNNASDLDHLIQVSFPLL
jgi:hypothetical protein